MRRLTGLKFEKVVGDIFLGNKSKEKGIGGSEQSASAKKIGNNLDNMKTYNFLATSK